MKVIYIKIGLSFHKKEKEFNGLYGFRGVEKAGPGECGAGGGTTCVCDSAVKPVCGIDGVTYPNHCDLDCHGRQR